MKLGLLYSKDCSSIKRWLKNMRKAETYNENRKAIIGGILKLKKSESIKKNDMIN